VDRRIVRNAGARGEGHKPSSIVPPGTFSPLHEGVAASDLPDSAKVLHAVLCGYARGSGVAWPSVATLCDKTHQGMNTVRRGIKRLCAAGLLVEIGRHRSGTIRYSVTNPEDVLPLCPTSRALAERGGANLDPPSQFGPPAKLGAPPSQIGRDTPPNLEPEVLYRSTKEAQEAEPQGFAMWWSMYPETSRDARKAEACRTHWQKRGLEQRVSGVLFWFLAEYIGPGRREGPWPCPLAWLKSAPWNRSRIPIQIDPQKRQQYGLLIHFSLSLSQDEQAPYLAMFADSITPVLQRLLACQAWDEQRGRQ
jgi:hypothetical protein